MSDIDESTSPEEGQSWAERNYGGIKLAVIIMSILLVIGFFAVFGTIIYRIMAASGNEEAPVAAQPVAVPQPAIAALGPDAEVVSTALDRQLLAITAKSGGRLVVLVVNLRTGAVERTIALDAQ